MHNDNKIKIAVPTNDGESIFPKMLGRAREFYIYEVGNSGEFKLIEKRNNPYEDTMQHLKTLDVYKLIDDCTIIISAVISKKGVERLKKRGMKLFFKKGDIQQVLNEVIKEIL
ncbi:hypothetical protein JXI42_04900 [bacterium]|nr:hypothetical protein [bacterium]